jgi:hypothetical protein
MERPSEGERFSGNENKMKKLEKKSEKNQYAVVSEEDEKKFIRILAKVKAAQDMLTDAQLEVDRWWIDAKQKHNLDTETPGTYQLDHRTRLITFNKK